MRFGLLASWRRTMLVFALYWTVLLVTSFMSGVLQAALFDAWVYVLLLFTILGIWTVNETVKGFDQIFDIFDPEFEATEANPGSEEKIIVLQKRIEKGLPLFHPDDVSMRAPFGFDWLSEDAA